MKEKEDYHNLKVTFNIIFGNSLGGLVIRFNPGCGTKIPVPRSAPPPPKKNTTKLPGK